MEKTGRFDYGKVQGFWSAKHPFKKIKDICEYGLTQRSTFPKRKQQKQQLRSHWGKKSQSNRKMEKVKRWGDLPETTTGFCHPKKDTRNGQKSPRMERKNASEVKIIRLMSALEKNDRGVLLPLRRRQWWPGNSEAVLGAVRWQLWSCHFQSLFLAVLYLGFYRLPFKVLRTACGNQGAMTPSFVIYLCTHKGQVATG